MTRSARVLLGAFAAASCLVPTIQPQPGTESATGDTGSNTAATDATSASAEDPSISTDATGSPTTTETTEDMGTGESAETTGGGGPNGAECMTQHECLSGRCYALGALGGICGECDSDDDCTEITGFGCNPPDIAAPVIPAMCGDGELGAGCESSAACVRGLTCELVLSIPLVHEFMNCSACVTHDDCSGDEICALTIDITTISGFWSCLPPGSVEIGGTCDQDGDGDLACASGNCAEADIDNLAFMGVCSECDEESDCDEGWHCQEASIDTFNVMTVPAVCVQD